MRKGKMQYKKFELIQLEGAASLATLCIAVSECSYFPPALTACFTIYLRGKTPFITLSTFTLNCPVNP